MKSFRQHLRDLEKKRKDIHKPSGDGYFNLYVHGAHSQDKFANYVNDLKEQAFFNLSKNDLNNLQNTYDYQKDHPSGKELDERLGEHYKDINLHPDSANLKKYTEYSNPLNKSLMKQYEDLGHNEEDLPLEERNKKKLGLDRILRTVEAPEDIVTYSGLGFNPLRRGTSDPKELAHLFRHSHLGNITPSDSHMYIHSPAYLSSSIRFNVATGFANTIDPETNAHGMDKNGIMHQHVARILVPKGSKRGLYVNTLSYFGRHNKEEYGSGEMEFLHPRGVTYRVRTTPSVILTNYYGEKNTATYVWDFEPVASIHPGLIK